MWALDLVQERFYRTNSGDFESMFMKVVNTETKEGLRRRINKREPRQCSVLAP